MCVDIYTKVLSESVLYVCEGVRERFSVFYKNDDDVFENLHESLINTLI